MHQNKLTPYFFPLFLLCAIISGGCTGYLLGPQSQYLKPLGDIFLNLILTVIVPLIFFSITLAIAKTSANKSLGALIGSMTVVFICTSIIAALYALVVLYIVPPTTPLALINLSASNEIHSTSLAEQLVSMFSVTQFNQLLSHQHMLALITFAILLGIAVTKTDAPAQQSIIRFLQIGETLFMRFFDLIMYLAPIGFFAYFAVLVSELGPQLMGNYVHITLTYYATTIIYFLLASTGFAYLAAKKKGIVLFWSNISIPMLTALATCSSAATIPSNLTAVKKMTVPAAIADTVIPLGSLIHKDGSVIGGVFKIAFLFALFHLDFSGVSTISMALGVSLLVGTVMGAIPSGGMLGELLILTVYGFPSSALIAIAAISILIDPLATMLNVTSNSVSSMLITRLIKKNTRS